MWHYSVYMSHRIHIPVPVEIMFFEMVRVAAEVRRLDGPDFQRHAAQSAAVSRIRTRCVHREIYGIANDPNDQ